MFEILRPMRVGDVEDSSGGIGILRRLHALGILQVEWATVVQIRFTQVELTELGRAWVEHVRPQARAMSAASRAAGQAPKPTLEKASPRKTTMPRGRADVKKPAAPQPPQPSNSAEAAKTANVAASSMATPSNDQLQAARRALLLGYPNKTLTVNNLDRIIYETLSAHKLYDDRVIPGIIHALIAEDVLRKDLSNPRRPRLMVVDTT